MYGTVSEFFAEGDGRDAAGMAPTLHLSVAQGFLDVL